MLEYSLITLNMIEYGDIYLCAEYARTQNVSDAVHSIRSLYKLLGSYRGRDIYSQRCQTFKMKRFAKRFFVNTRKRGPTRKHFGVVFLDTLKTAF